MVTRRYETNNPRRGELRTGANLARELYVLAEALSLLISPHPLTSLTLRGCAGLQMLLPRPRKRPTRRPLSARMPRMSLGGGLPLFLPELFDICAPRLRRGPQLSGDSAVNLS